MAFAEDINAAIALLGGPDGDPLVDFLVDPGRACAALDALPEHGGLVLRAAPALGAAVAGYAPAPADPIWLRIMRGAREVGTATLHGGEGMVRRAARIELEEHDEGCCDAPGCDRRRLHAAVWLVLDGAAHGDAPARLLVAETHALEGERASDLARAVGARLASALGVPFERGGEPIEAGDAEPPAPLAEPLSAPELGRFALRTEGASVVLRDWDSAGPRATAARNAWIGAALMLGAAALWLGLYRALGVAAQSTSIALGAAAALLSLAGYAFLGVARFSAKYRAASAPLVAVGHDRLIVLPWVGRDGAVDLRPEGRLGAAIPLHEVRATSVQRRRGGVAVELDTDHGPIDALLCASEATAAVWGLALDRAVDEARHPRAGASARQRARARAQAAPA
jgi:hypothetical protein